MRITKASSTRHVLSQFKTPRLSRLADEVKRQSALRRDAQPMTGQMLVIAVTDALAGRVQRRLHTRNQSANMPLAVTRERFLSALATGRIGKPLEDPLFVVQNINGLAALPMYQHYPTP
jgi:hypothetical protein